MLVDVLPPLASSLSHSGLPSLPFPLIPSLLGGPHLTLFVLLHGASHPFSSSSSSYMVGPILPVPSSSSSYMVGPILPFPVPANFNQMLNLTMI